MKEGGRKVLQIFNQFVSRVGPVHRKVETVFVAPYGVGKVARIRSVGDDEELQEFIQRLLTVEALLAVAVHLVEGFADGLPALFQLHLHHGQPVDQDGHIVAVGLCAGLLKLVNHLHLIASYILFIHQANVLDTPFIIEHEAMAIIDLHLMYAINDTAGGLRRSLLELLVEVIQILI